MHYIIIVAVVLAIVVIQVSIFISTKTKIDAFKNIFASSGDSYSFGNRNQIEDAINRADDEQLKMMLNTAGHNTDDFYSVAENEEGIEVFVFNYSQARECLLADYAIEKGISSNHKNPIFEEIVIAINNYLSNNKGSVSDFHLMKDIVDRNCDAKEEEIDAQIPVPLYLGLMGTMVGILVGIGYLWMSGDLTALLDAGNNKAGIEGVKALLGGVALAMISSILGIILTTRGSMKAKEAKAEEEKYKHVFLSWIQANLLPNLSNDTAQTLERMSSNLVAFNNTFSSNTEELGKALAQVNEATKLQRQLMVAVEKLADKNISKQNLEVYSALKNCSEEIGTLGKYLNCSNEYLIAVRDLNEKLDKDERRSKAVERMAVFFENETTQLEQRKAIISKTVGEIDSQLEEQLRKLGEHASENVDKFYQALGKQQDALQKRLDETQIIVGELKNLSAVKESVAKFEKAITEQNKKIDRLTDSIKTLVESKASSTPSMMVADGHSRRKSPLGVRLVIGFVSVLAILIVIAVTIANWDEIYAFIRLLFRF